MPFFRPLSETVPDFDRNVPWPIGGLAYVAAFMGPISAGPLIGVVTFHWTAAGVGLLLGIGISLLNGWLTDRFLEPWIARRQRLFQRGTPRILANIAAFAWASFLSGLSMLAPFVLFGSSLVLRFRQ
jgi:hypothetical protein